MTQPILSLSHLVLEYPGHPPYRAINDVSFDVMPEEFFGIVGESGSGKSTLAKAICKLIPISGGMLSRPKKSLQMIFQDAAGSLNPRKTIRSTLAEVFATHPALGNPKPTDQQLSQLLNEVGLPAEVLAAYPRELSGGQCQRVSIARALAVNPKVLIADEPVSALDVSVQARVLNLLAELRQKRHMTIVLISHDLAVVRTVCDRLIVLHQGQIVERGRALDVFTHPQHEYTKRLLAAVPDISSCVQ